MLGEIQEMLKTLHREIGYKYIKFHGILSDDMMVYDEDELGNPSLNFCYVDKVLDFLISINLKPLIQLSFMPKLLAKKPDNRRFYSEFIISEPKDLNKWTFLITEFTKHLLNRYGQTEVESWLFCVWNEPDTPATMFGFEEDDVFFEFYKSTYFAVKEINPNIVFGGSSTIPLSSYNKKWSESFDNWCLLNNCVPDFINIHFYDMDFDNAPPRKEWSPAPRKIVGLSEDVNSFSKFITRLKSHLKKEGQEKRKIYLTEWNSTPSHRDLMSDTCFKS